MRNFIFFILICLSALGAQATTSSVALWLKGAGQGEGLSGADVEMKTDSTKLYKGRTNESGRVFVESIETGEYQLSIMAVGYQDHHSILVVTEEHVMKEIVLQPLETDAFTTVLQTKNDLEVASPSSIVIDGEELRKMPGTGGDPLRALETLPGVARPPLLGGSLMLRGGFAADTNVMIDGVSIPQLNHFGGLSSVIHPRFIQQLEFMAGGFTSRYGQAVAGIVNIEPHSLTKQKSKHGFRADIDVDFADVGFYIAGELPLWKSQPMHVAFAARRSHLELLGNAVLFGAHVLAQPLEYLPMPVYNDFQFRLELPLSARHTISLMLFGAEDGWAFLGNTDALNQDILGEQGLTFEQLINRNLGSNFIRVIGGLDSQHRDTWQHKLRIFAGSTRRGLLSDNVAVSLLSNGALTTPSDFIDIGIRDEWSKQWNSWIRSVYGFELNNQSGEVEVVRLGDASSPLNNPLSDLGFTDVKTRASILSLYTLTTFQLGPYVRLQQGFRAEATQIALLADDIRYQNILYGKTSTHAVNNWSFDPRWQLHFQPVSSWFFKAAVGRYHRLPSLHDAAHDTDGTTLKRPKAWHFIGGLEHTLAEFTTLDVQLYAIPRSDLTRTPQRHRVSSGSVFQGGPNIIAAGSYDSEGHGFTYGAEVFLRRQLAPTWRGWLSYTLSRTTYDLGEYRDGSVPFAYDQTHNLQIATQWQLPWSMQLGVRFAVVTGNPNPVPLATNVIYDVNTDTYTPQYSQLRHERLPWYHRLDVRLDKQWRWSWCTLSAYIDVVNVYNWPNAEVLFPSGDYRGRTMIPVIPGIPLLPQLGLEFTI